MASSFILSLVACWPMGSTFPPNPFPRRILNIHFRPLRKSRLLSYASVKNEAKTTPQAKTEFVHHPVCFPERPFPKTSGREQILLLVPPTLFPLGQRNNITSLGGLLLMNEVMFIMLLISGRKRRSMSMKLVFHFEIVCGEGAFLTVAPSQRNVFCLSILVNE